jgi:hypothetical protein
MPRAALLLACLAISAGTLSACGSSQRPVSNIVQPAPGNPNTNPAVVAACREAMAQQIARQDRGQLIREDERQARLGSDTMGTVGFRAPIDRMGREFQYERMVEQCVRQNTQASQAQQAQPAATPAPPPAAAPPPARRSAR